MLPTLRTGRRMARAGRQWLSVWGAIVAHGASPFRIVQHPGIGSPCRARGIKGHLANAVCANRDGVLIQLSGGSSQQRPMVSAFASDGAGERLSGRANFPLRPASRASGTSGVLAGAGGHRMTDTLSSTMVPGRCDDTERFDPPFLDGKLQVPRLGFPV